MEKEDNIHFNKDDHIDLKDDNNDTIQELIREDSKMEWLTSRMEAMNIKNKENKIGYCFDEKMLMHKDFGNYHSECPERAMSIYMNLLRKGYSDKLSRIQVKEIEEELILKVHTKEYLAIVANLENEEKYKTETGYRLNYDTYDNYYTYLAAKMSAGGLISCIDETLKGEVSSSFAIIRPPGHHAYESECYGFCFFNNVAIAAKYLLGKELTTYDNENKKVVKTIKKVAIIDWDVHHGNGTQEIFYEDENVLFISLHRYDKATFYPFRSHANYTQCGKAQGEGFNINIPWNTTSKLYKSSDSTMVYDEEYIAAFELIVKPVLKEYNADFILVSCGFDAAEKDPLGKLSVSPFGYYYMMSELKNICSSTSVALEGGYNLNSLAMSSEGIIRALLGLDHRGLDYYDEKYKKLVESEIDYKEVINNLLFTNRLYAEDLFSIRKHLSKHWKSLDIKDFIEKNDFSSNLFSKRLVEIYNKLSKNKNNNKNFSKEEIDSIEDEKTKKEVEFEMSLENSIKLRIEKVNIEKLSLKDYRILSKTTSLENNFRILGVKGAVGNFKEDIDQAINMNKDLLSQNLSVQASYDIIYRFLSTNKIRKESFFECISGIVADLKIEESSNSKHNEIPYMDVVFYPQAIQSNNSNVEDGSIKSRLRSQSKVDYLLKYRLSALNIGNNDDLNDLKKAIFSFKTLIEDNLL